MHLTIKNSIFLESWKYNKALLPVSLPHWSILAKFRNLNHSVKVSLLLSLCRDYSQRELNTFSKPLLKLLRGTKNLTNQFHPSVRKKEARQTETVEQRMLWRLTSPRWWWNKARDFVWSRLRNCWCLVLGLRREQKMSFINQNTKRGILFLKPSENINALHTERFQQILIIKRHRFSVK